MKDHINSASSDLAAHTACINLHIESIKQLCTTDEPLQELRTLYQITHKLFRMMHTYEQHIQTHHNLSWLKSVMQSFTFFKKAHPSIEKESKRFIFFTKMTAYEILYQQVERQVSALKAEVEDLLKQASFFKSPLSDRYRLNNPIPLLTVIQIARKTHWVYSFLALLQSDSSDQSAQISQGNVAFHLSEVFNQTKQLFHVIYTQSIKNLMTLVMSKMDKLPQLYDIHQPFYLMHIVKQIKYIQSYATYCILPDQKLHNEIMIFNRCILAHFGSDHPQLAIVLRAQKTIDSTGASIHPIVSHHN